MISAVRSNSVSWSAGVNGSVDRDMPDCERTRWRQQDSAAHREEEESEMTPRLRAVTPLTQAGRKSRGLVWEGENFTFAHVKFEVLAKHRDRELVSSPRKRRNKRWLQTEPVAK